MLDDDFDKRGFSYFILIVFCHVLFLSIFDFRDYPLSLLYLLHPLSWVSYMAPQGG